MRPLIGRTLVTRSPVDIIRTVHTNAREVVFAAVVLASVFAFIRARGAETFGALPFLITAILVDIQVLLGLVLVIMGDRAQGLGRLIAHGLVMLLALGAVHAGLGRGRTAAAGGEVDTAYQMVGAAFAAAVLFIAIGLAIILWAPGLVPA